LSQDLRDEINPCSMPQGASRAVSELILRGLAFRDYKTHCRAKIGADTEPFSHSLGHERSFALQRKSTKPYP
jgi:hypothetical protein